MPTQKDEVCSMCEAEPEDMLILTCRHNLCLDCATQLYNLNTKNDQIMCQICLSSTPLDTDTIVCLRSLSAKTINQNAFQASSHTHTSDPADYQRMQYPPIPKSQYQPYHVQQLPMIHEQAPTPRCQKHNEPLTYYCLECNIYKICSQCMLLQNHRYHKVVTIKKASLQIRQTIEKVGREKHKLKNLLQKDKESLHLRKEESDKQLEVNLAELKDVFDEVIKLIGLRYEEMKNNMQIEAVRKIEIMEGAINEMQQKITLIEETVQFEDELIKSCSMQQLSCRFQMFDYYESEISKNRLNFEPSLPNFISEVSPETVLNKENVLGQIEDILNSIATGTDNDQSQFEDNINLISQIDNENLHVLDALREKRTQNSMKKRAYLQENTSMTGNYKRPISENINIIQLHSEARYGLKQKKEAIPQSKKSNIEAIKRKARQNMKDRELSNSRKMQLSRSIENATDILNKIQQRSAKA